MRRSECVQETLCLFVVHVLTGLYIVAYYYCFSGAPSPGQLNTPGAIGTVDLPTWLNMLILPLTSSPISHSATRTTKMNDNSGMHNFILWAENKGIKMDGIEPTAIPSRGIGIVATREIRVGNGVRRWEGV